MGWAFYHVHELELITIANVELHYFDIILMRVALLDSGTI